MDGAFRLIRQEPSSGPEGKQEVLGVAHVIHCRKPPAGRILCMEGHPFQRLHFKSVFVQKRLSQGGKGFENHRNLRNKWIFPLNKCLSNVYFGPGSVLSAVDTAGNQLQVLLLTVC